MGPTQLICACLLLQLQRGKSMAVKLCSTGNHRCTIMAAILQCLSSAKLFQRAILSSIHAIH